MMGTELSVRLWHDDPEQGRALVEEFFAEAQRINLLMSTYIEDSEISAINRDAADRPVTAGDDKRRVEVRDSLTRPIQQLLEKTINA